MTRFRKLNHPTIGAVVLCLAVSGCGVKQGGGKEVDEQMQGETVSSIERSILEVSHVDATDFRLTFLDRMKIEDEDFGLHEPSGLALSRDRKALWVISDDTDRIIKLALDGTVLEDGTFDIPDRNLEGIALHPTEASLFVVKESNNEILKIGLDEREVLDRKRLNEMEGFATVAEFFQGGGANKGLEGITWNDDTGVIVVVKEGEPGLLIEVSADLERILRFDLLSGEDGIRDSDLEPGEIDFSGLWYDSNSGLFWIVSDKARRLYLYSWGEGVVRSAALGYAKDGEYKEIKKAEGIALDTDTSALYVVSDDEARLYIFDVRH